MGSPALACGIFTIALIIGGLTIPLGIFYVRIGTEYEDDACLRHIAKPDLALWLKVLGWTKLGMASFCIPFIILVAAIACKTTKAVYGLGAIACVILPGALFLFAWTIIGMIRLSQSADCHQHAAELWNWTFAAVLLMTGPMLSVTIGGGSKMGSLVTTGDDD